MKLLEKYNLSDGSGKVIIQSFSQKSLKIIRELNSEILLIQLQGKKELNEQRLIDIIKYADGIGPNINYIDESYIREARKLGLLVHPYKADEIPIDEIKDMGATGVFSNLKGDD